MQIRNRVSKRFQSTHSCFCCSVCCSVNSEQQNNIVGVEQHLNNRVWLEQHPVHIGSPCVLWVPRIWTSIRLSRVPIYFIQYLAGHSGDACLPQRRCPVLARPQERCEEWLCIQPTTPPVAFPHRPSSSAIVPPPPPSRHGAAAAVPCELRPRSRYAVATEGPRLHTVWPPEVSIPPQYVGEYRPAFHSSRPTS